MKNTTPPADPQERGYTAFWATFWRVTQQAVRDWLRADKMPFPHDIDGMLKWAVIPGRKPNGFLQKVGELRAERAPSGEKHVDPDWQEFIGQSAANASTDPLELMRDYYQFKLRRANESAEENGIRIYSDLVIKYEKAIRDNKLAAERLGLEEGILLPRAEVERLAWSIAYWLMQSTNMHLDALTSKLLPFLAPGQATEPVRRVLDAELLSDRFLIPFGQAARIRAGVTLPEWLVTKMRTACGDFLENGESQFDETAATNQAKSNAPRSPSAPVE